jgi:hypothetical protein
LFFCGLYWLSQRPGGSGGADLWVTRRASVSDPWGAPENLGSLVNSARHESEPHISADSLELYFSSDRPGGEGGYDLYVTTRSTKDGVWEEPVNLGMVVNSLSSDMNPCISSDGLALFFASERSNGPRGLDWDIWMTRRRTKDSTWGEPVNLGPIVNDADAQEPYHISPDGSILYLDTGHSLFGKADLWQAPIIPIVDLNGDGIVDAADMVIMVDHWGTGEPLCDIGPMPWGDGIVNIQDLIILAKHLFEDYRQVAYWQLNETEGNIAYDSIGGNDGICHGGPVWVPAGGNIGGALRFDGLDDYVSTPFILNPANGSLSVFAWVKGGMRGQAIISQGEGTFGSNSTWLCTDSSAGRFITHFIHPPFPPLESQSVITDGQWHHVGLVYDRNALHRYLYVDGAEVAKDVGLVPPIGSDGGLYIGAGESLDATSFWSGLIDDVRIYNNVLSAEEIATLAQ